MELKGSQTEKNLEAAFAGESKATNKYSYYASQAKDGFEQIGGIFSKPPETNANMPNYGLNICTAEKFEYSGKLRMRLPVSIMNGRKCIKVSPKLPDRKGSRKSQPILSWWQRSKRPRGTISKAGGKYRQ